MFRGRHGGWRIREESLSNRGDKSMEIDRVLFVNILGQTVVEGQNV